MNVLIANSKLQKSDYLVDIIHQHDSQINILAKTSTIDDTLKFISQNASKIDLTFLETRLKDGSIFDFVNQKSISSPIVFTSNQKQDAYEAIKANSLDFLLEPFKADEVLHAINKAKLHMPSLNEDKQNYKKRFLIKFGDKIQFKTTDEISYIFAEGKIAYIVTSVANRKYIIEHTLDELEKRHLDPANFYRINRKFIVNINAIEEARNYVNSRLKLILNPPTDFDMVVSREKVSDFKNWLNL